MLTLSDKITTAEDWMQVAERECLNPQASLPRLLGSGSGIGVAAWWVARERARIDRGVYQITTELQQVNSLNFGLFAHISTKDATMVAYTPDRAAGEADRQVVASPGRFFSKYLPYASEDLIRRLTEQYNAYVNLKVEFISGPDIAVAYDTFSAGVAACMSRKGFPVHPALAYDAPGIRLAVCRDEDGDITGRTLVYEPSENDKRYIRVYGNPALGHALARAGYKLGTLGGAKLAKHKVRDGVYAVPYLDGSGTGGDWYVAAFSDHLKVLDRAEVRRFRNLGIDVKAASATGQLRLDTADLDSFTQKDMLTGDTFNLLEVDGPKMVFKGGKFGYTRVTAPPGYIELTVHRGEAGANGELAQLALVPESEAIKVDGYSSLCPNHPYTLRSVYSFNLLSEKHYGPNFWTARPARQGLLVSDAVKLIQTGADGVDRWVLVHKSEVPDGAVKLHSVSGETVYADQGVKYEVTSTKRKVHPLTHDVAKVVTGTYEFKVSRSLFHFGGEVHFYYLKKDKARLHTGELADCMYDHLLQTMGSFSDAASLICAEAYARSVYEDSRLGRRYTTRYSFQNLRARPLDVVMQILEGSMRHYVSGSLESIVIQQMAYKLLVAYAEMSAVEY